MQLPFDWMSSGTDLAMRNTERLFGVHIEGMREWMSTLESENAPPARQIEKHLDQALHLGCEYWVTQVSAVTDSMHLFERALAETQREWLHSFDQHEVAAPALHPVRSAICFSGCAYDSMSKATRQVANFASSRFSAAAISAFQQACDRLAETV
ncbi:hypothetical protein KSF73_13015 [Burkholderiaceae bacterium DAT-1]|nr:hypothetical protein [Burkholderiaceae bacterium DAT-1]